MNRKLKPRSREFWALVADHQIELTTKREKAGGQGKPKQRKHQYKLDTYQGVEYTSPLNNKFTTKPEPVDTTQFKVTKLQSQIHTQRRSTL